MREIRTGVHARRPNGASFILDSCPFRPGEQFDYAALSLPEGRVLDWPMIYVLTNGTEAYVGQTTSIRNRMNQHGANAEKRLFETATIIYNDEFNGSVITDYEHQLIEHMRADGLYRLTNKNDGWSNGDYFSKREYGLMFRDLWEDLRGHRLADGRRLAQHTIDEIEDSEVFKYSPYKALNAEQMDALERICAVVDRGLDGAEPIVVEGNPGTGKTVLAIYLLKMLKDDPRYAGMNIRILEPVTSLRNTLRDALSTVSGLSGDDVIGPSDIAKPQFGHVRGEKKCFDILLVDEAHRLKRRKNLVAYRAFDDTNRALGLPRQATQLDWILDQAKLPILFYDPLQSVGPSGIGAEGMRCSLGGAAEHPVRLESQMRVKGGDDYLAYVKDILWGREPAPRAFDGYEFVLHEDFCDFAESFEDTHAAHDLTRFVAGYAWEWKSKSDKQVYDIDIDGIRLRWNCTTVNWVPMGSADTEAARDIAREVGCIHTVQGYDLSYAYVIVGEDIRLDPETGLLVADRTNYHDRNGKATATDEELADYIRNIYYVLLTRGIYGTHVYVCDPKLREHLRRFFVQGA